MVLGIADDRIAGTGKFFFGGTGDGRVERGENEVAIEVGFEASDDEVSGSCGDRSVEVPLHGFGVFFAGGAFGGGNLGKHKPRMASEKLNEALADDAGGAEDSGAELSIKMERRRTHAAPLGLEL